LNNIDTSQFGRKLPPGVRPSSTRSKLRKKLATRKKQTGETANKPNTPIGADEASTSNSVIDEDSLFNMLNQVNQILKQNPEMVKKVSSCVNNIFENKELLNNIVSQIEKNQNEPDVQDQSLDSKDDELD
ncbi:hypothetical protein EBU91_05370, partial [bacterium]|nr:hypothetical protein [bacterium]